MYDIQGEYVGDWIATVAWYDDRWDEDGGDGIVLADELDAAELTERQISWTSTALNNPKSAEGYQDISTTTLVRGHVENGGTLEFRIGLQEEFTAGKGYSELTPNHTSTFPARYAIVTLRYDNGATQKLFLRQGEGPDYLMHTNDSISAPAVTGHAAFSSATRLYARKWSPYNLTAPASGYTWPTAYTATATAGVALNGGRLADYPTQGGSFTRGNLNRQLFAPHLTTDITNWVNAPAPSTYWNTAMETCPSGYRRPNDHPTPTTSYSTLSATNSEIRQSLWHKPSHTPTTGTTIGTPEMRENVTSGYYADGYFDRRAIVASPNNVANSAVSATTAGVAYRGMLFFNPLDKSVNYNASLFFPNAGTMTIPATNVGRVSNTGGGTFYLTQSINTNNGFVLYTSDPSITGGAHTLGYVVRCVRP